MSAIVRLMGSDALKFKRTWIWLLVLLGPVGVVGMTWVNYLIRYDWLTREGGDLWPGLMGNIHMLLIMALPLGAALLASMAAGTEHQGNMWKQLLAMPVSRTGLFLSKFLWLFLQLLLAALLVVGGTAWLGLELGFGPDVPWALVWKQGMLPFLAALPVMALQLWLSMIKRNQALPFMMGVVGVFLSMSAASSGAAAKFMPWAYYVLAGPTMTPDMPPPQWALLGCGVGVVLLIIGALDFARREA